MAREQRPEPADPWEILRQIDEYVRVAGRFKDVNPIRDFLTPVRKQLRA